MRRDYDDTRWLKTILSKMPESGCTHIVEDVNMRGKALDFITEIGQYFDIAPIQINSDQCMDEDFIKAIDDNSIIILPEINKVQSRCDVAEIVKLRKYNSNLYLRFDKINALTILPEVRCPGKNSSLDFLVAFQVRCTDKGYRISRNRYGSSI